MSFLNFKSAAIVKKRNRNLKKTFIERVVDHLPLMTYGLKLSLEA